MKFIYFDVGGVLIEDFSGTDGWNLLTKEWGILKEQKNELDKMFYEFGKEADLGRNPDDFLDIVTEKFGIKFPKNYSINNNFVAKFRKNEGIEKILKKINGRYRLGLLTNMYRGMLELIKEKELIPNIDWKVIIDSSLEKCKKPEMKIYEIAQEKSKTEASEILLIDNKKENLDNPKKLGWKTFWFNSFDYEESNRELEKILG